MNDEVKRPWLPSDFAKKVDDWVMGTQKSYQQRMFSKYAATFPTAFPEVTGIEVSEAWKDVLDWWKIKEPQESFQKKTSAERDSLRMAYFEQIVKPKAKTPEEAVELRKHFTKDFADSFLHGVVASYTGMSDRFLLPPKMKPSVAAAEFAGQLAGALPIYMAAGAATKLQALKGVPEDMYQAIRQLALSKGPPALAAPSILRAPTFTGRGLQGAMTFALAETPAIAGGAVPITDLLKTGLYGVAFGGPQSTLTASILSAATAGTLEGPQAALQLGAMTGLFRGFGLVTPKIKERFIRGKEFAHAQLETFLKGYVERGSVRRPVDQVGIPSVDASLDEMVARQAKDLAEGVEKIKRDAFSAEQEVKRMGLPDESLTSLRLSQNKVMQARGAENVSDLILSFNDFYGELALLSEKIGMKFTRSLENAELKTTPETDARIQAHPDTPTGKFLLQLRSHPIRINSDIYRLTDDTVRPGTSFSELDKYLAKMIAGKGRSVSYEQLQELRISPDELPELVRTAREQNLLSTEPFPVEEAPISPTTSTFIYHDAFNYLPRHRVREFAERMKALVDREKALPPKLKKKLWLEFERDINKSVKEYGEDLLRRGKKPTELKEEMPEEAVEEAVETTDEPVGFISSAGIRKEFLQRLADQKFVEIERTEGPAKDLEEQKRRESRARVEADRMYSEVLSAPKATEPEPSAHEQMVSMIEKMGAREAELYKVGFSTGEAIFEGIDPVDNPYQIAQLFERKGVRGRWDSKQRRLWVQDEKYDWKETSMQKLEDMPDAGDITTTGELVITLHGDDTFAIVKRGDKWSLASKTGLTKAAPPSKPYRLQEYPKEAFGLKKPPRQLWEIEHDQARIASLSDLHDENARAFWDKLGPFPEGWTSQNINEVLLMFGEFTPLSPKKGPLTDVQLGRSVMQMFEAYSDRKEYVGKEGFPQRIQDFRRLAAWLRHHNFIGPRAVTPFEEGLFHKGSVEALIASSEYGPGRKGQRTLEDLNMQDILELMYAQGYTVEWRQPDGGLFYRDLYNGKEGVMYVENLDQFLKNPREIPDFTPELKVPMDPTSFNPAGLQMPSDPPPPKWHPLWERWVQPRKYRFETYERVSGVPIRQVWRSYEEVLVKLRKWIKSASIRQDYIRKGVDPSRYWEVMHYLRQPGPLHERAQLAKELKLTRDELRTAEDLREFSMEVLGTGAEQLFQEAADYMGTGERAPFLDTWMRKYGWRPEYLTDMRNFLRNLIGTEVRKVTRPYVERLSELMKDVKESNITDETKRKINQDIRAYRDRTVAGLTGDFEATSDFVKRVNKRFGWNLPGSVTDYLTSTYLMGTYASTMPFRWGLVIRNLLQPSATTGLTFGYSYLGKAYTYAFSREGRQLAEELLITEPQVVAFQEALPKKALGVRKLYDIGMQPYFRADKLNRIVSASAAYLKFKDFAPKYQRGEISLKEFLRETGLIYFDKGTQQEVLAPLIGGDIEAAAKRAAFNGQEDTQWIYRAANAPWAFERFGRWGRLAGQFGIWPASYIQFFKRGISSGDPVATSAFLRRFTAFNSIALALGMEVLGVDVRNWVFLGPLSYTGGPGIQAFENIRDIMSSLTYGEWRRDMAIRNIKESALTMIPFRSAVRDRLRALQQTEVSDAVKRYFGLRPWPPRHR